MHTDDIAATILHVLEFDGPTPFLRLAEKVAPRCRVSFRDVEDVQRILFSQRRLRYDENNLVTLNTQPSRGVYTNGGHRTRSSDGASSQRR